MIYKAIGLNEKWINDYSDNFLATANAARMCNALVTINVDPETGLITAELLEVALKVLIARLKLLA